MAVGSSDEVLYGYRLRTEQRRILAYRQGRMAVAAVPGSGKTLTLSLLAARLISEGCVGAESEVLVVTVQNSAVANIGQRIRSILQAQKMPPVGFRVCTLHKLAADILRRRQDLAGVDDTLAIVDDSESQRLLDRAIHTWLSTHQTWWESYLPEERGNSTAAERAWLRETAKVGREVIKLCKHLRLTAQQAEALVATSDEQDEFLRMGVDLYALYGGYLQVRGGLDFDDLIWRAIDTIESEPGFLERLQGEWPYILEDEAQDSSPLQERILETLAGPLGNWVRVGDVNQSINSTFTAADPRYFRRFLQRSDVATVALPQSGRCGRPIMALANELVDSTSRGHPDLDIREMAFEPQRMVPTEEGDPQPNPPDGECWIGFPVSPRASESEEAAHLAGLAGRYVLKNPDKTCAVLCPTHGLGEKVVTALAALDDPPVPYDDLLRSTPRTRDTAAMLGAVIGYLASPTNSAALERLFERLRQAGYLGAESAGPEQSGAIRRDLLPVLRSVPCEGLLFPQAGATLRDLAPAASGLSDAHVQLLARLRDLVARWVRASALPVDQLILTVAQDLYEDELALAVCHVLASGLATLSASHPEWQLTEFHEELDAVAHNRRGMGALSLTEAGYVDQPGKVIVTTMHKAKGLEWDTVFLMGVDSLEFPDDSEGAFRDELFFMPGRAPAAEARKRLEQLAGAEFASPPEESPIEASRREYIAERLRLLYVGITRARRYLMFSCSQSRGEGRRRPVQPAGALAVLQRQYKARARGGQT